MTIAKVCPVILRQREVIEILAFEHPLAGFQLVKGSVETGESPTSAAVRELYEESGILNASVPRFFGAEQSSHQDQIWYFYLCSTQADLPDHWIHRTADDGGHDFRFFWQSLCDLPSQGWHEVFQWALGYIRDKISSG
jgi:8-oxo-dGTP pyrophosphatase MutT (NUDIX family)